MIHLIVFENKYVILATSLVYILYMERKNIKLLLHVCATAWTQYHLSVVHNKYSLTPHKPVKRIGSCVVPVSAETFSFFCAV